MSDAAAIFVITDDAVYASGDNAADEWSALRADFRVDRHISDVDTLMLTGDIYNGHSV